jgi:hypothetical protein
MSKTTSVGDAMIVAVDVYDAGQIDTLPMNHEVALKTEIRALISLSPASIASETERF